MLLNSSSPHSRGDYSPFSLANRLRNKKTLNTYNSPSILVADTDQTTQQLLDSLLAKEGYEIIATQKGTEAFSLAVNQQPAVVVLNAALRGIDGYSLCRRLRENPTTHDVPILMLGGEDQVSARIAGFEAGADDYLVKPFHPKELAYRVRNLIERAAVTVPPRAPEKPRGRITAFFSAKGGVGKTTLSVNVAVTLSRRGKRVALVDADFQLGTVGVTLDLAPRRTISDLAGHFEELDPELMDQVMGKHASGLRVLQSPVRPEEAEKITPANVKQLLTFLTAQYDYVIVDCQASYDERTVSILETADDIMLIALPEIHSIKNIGLYLDLASRLGLPVEKNHLILNRSDSNPGIKRQGIETTLEHRIDFNVASGGRQFLASANRGVPLVDDQPNSPLAQQLIRIAEGIERFPSPSSWAEQAGKSTAISTGLPGSKMAIAAQK